MRGLPEIPRASQCTLSCWGGLQLGSYYAERRQSPGLEVFPEPKLGAYEENFREEKSFLGETLDVSWAIHSQKQISISFQIEWNVFGVTIFHSFLCQMEFYFACIQKEKYHHDHIPLKLSARGNPFRWAMLCMRAGGSEWINFASIIRNWNIFICMYTYI